MDPLSQGLLGATAAQLSSQSKLPNSALIIGFLAGMAADLDILIRSSTNPMLFMVYHRHFTHSLFFIPFGGAIVAAFLCWVYPKFRASWKDVLIASIAGYATHGALDCFTSYGTVYFWPLTSKRYSLDWISIIDPIFTIPLLIGVIWGYHKSSGKTVLAFLFIALGYLCIGGIQHERAVLAQQALTYSRLHPVSHYRVMPTFANLFHWHSIYVSGNDIYVDSIYAPFFKKTQPYPILKVPHFKNNQLVQHKSWHQDIENFKWFTDDLVGVFQSSPLIIADMRYLIQIHPPTSLWGLLEPEDKNQQHMSMQRRLVLKVQ